MSGQAEAFGLPFSEAIAFLRQKVRLPTRRFDDLVGAANDRAFMVAGVQADDLLASIQGALVRAQEAGTTLDAFRADLDPLLDRLGWTSRGAKYTAWRTRIVYETNLRTAYAAGRQAQMLEMAEDLPIWVYRHSGSKHPRLQHQAWDGKALPWNDAWWQTHSPPNGWGCGCWIENMDARDLKRIEGKDGPDPSPEVVTRQVRDGATGQMVDVPVGVDPGWGYPPGRSWAEGLVPPELQQPLRPLRDAATSQPAVSLPPLPPPRPVDAARILPAGLTDESYVRAFLDAFGATETKGVSVRDVTGTHIVVDRRLFQMSGGDLKVKSRGRERYVLLLADALRDPDEVWADWEVLKNGEPQLRRRYLRQFILPNGQNGLVAFTWGKAGWYGRTAFNTTASYLEGQRTGALLYQRPADGNPGQPAAVQ